MSVFGGDSWAREAQYRKRRVDDLIIEGIDDASAYKKLPSGKIACLVCPQRPVLDTPLMFSTHIKGSRHQAAESRLKERELTRQYEINKRIALSDSSTDVSNSTTYPQSSGSLNKPLINLAKKAASEILNGNSHKWSTIHKSQDIRLENSHKTTENPPTKCKDTCSEVRAVSNEVDCQQSDYRDRREREVKFTAAGWKRDCHGRWFKDENVEFDSDEEDPNVSLA